MNKSARCRARRALTKWKTRQARKRKSARNYRALSSRHSRPVSPGRRERLLLARGRFSSARVFRAVCNARAEKRTIQLNRYRRVYQASSYIAAARRVASQASNITARSLSHGLSLFFSDRSLANSLSVSLLSLARSSFPRHVPIYLNGDNTASESMSIPAKPVFSRSARSSVVRRLKIAPRFNNAEGCRRLILLGAASSSSSVQKNRVDRSTPGRNNVIVRVYPGA